MAGGDRAGVRGEGARAGRRYRARVARMSRAGFFPDFISNLVPLAVFLGKRASFRKSARREGMLARRITLTAILAVGLVTTALAGGLKTVMQIKIGPQPVSAALLEFSDQTKLQVVSV